MQSFRLKQLGSLDYLQAVKEQIPEPAANEVLVKIRACSLNYRDLSMLYGTGTLTPKNGLIPLSDGAGEVVKLGASVSRFKVNDRVAGTFFPHWQAGRLTADTGRGAYGLAQDGWLTEYKVVNQEALVKLPDSLSFAEGSTLPCAAVTAWNSLTQSRPLQPGESVLIQGTGGVSLFALQFAKTMGLQVISLTSTAEKASLLNDLGADHIVNYKENPEWHRQVREITGGEGVERIVEVGGPGTFENSLKSVRLGGEIALIGFASQSQSPIYFMQLFKAGATIRPLSVGSREDFENMNRALSFKPIKPVISQTFDFDDSVSAWKYLEQKNHVGKVVILLG